MPRFQYVALDARGQESTGSWRLTLLMTPSGIYGRRDISQPAFMKKEKRQRRAMEK